MRAASVSASMKPKSWAATAASNAIPMLVGEVRWATVSSGTSWMLSGGSA